METCWQQFAEGLDALGEGPVWAPGEQALYWIDVVGRQLRRRPLADDRQEQWPLAGMPGSLAFRQRGGLLMTFRNAITLCSEVGGKPEPITDHPIDFASERINDGAVDAAGRFWFGTFSPRFEAGGGALYRMDSDLSIHRMDGGITMSNGLAWSPDGRSLYFCDSRPGRVYRYDFDSGAGTIANRTLLIDYAGRNGRPDGCAVDAEGFLWIAEVEGHRIARYDPAGRLERTIALPVSRPTSLAFGGVDMRSIFVTSMQQSMSPQELANEPLAGALFHLHTDIVGRPAMLFSG